METSLLFLELVQRVRSVPCVCQLLESIHDDHLK